MYVNIMTCDLTDIKNDKHGLLPMRQKCFFSFSFTLWPCSKACRILVTGPGIELVLPTVELTVAQIMNSLLQDEDLN